LLFFAFAFFDYVNFSADQASSSTIWRALGNQYGRLHGSFEFTKQSGQVVLSSLPMVDFISQSLLVGFTILVVIVLLNLALTIVLEVYNASDEKNDTVWAEQQATDIYFCRKLFLNRFLHAISRCIHALKKKSARAFAAHHAPSMSAIGMARTHFDLLDLPAGEASSPVVQRGRSLSTAGHSLLTDRVRRVRQTCVGSSSGLNQHLESVQAAGIREQFKKNMEKPVAGAITKEMDVEMGTFQLQDSPLVHNDGIDTVTETETIHDLLVYYVDDADQDQQTTLLGLTEALRLGEVSASTQVWTADMTDGWKNLEDTSWDLDWGLFDYEACDE
jgi:hypothetical protein